MVLARAGQHRLILELGREHGAAVDAVDNEGLSALMHAAAEGRFNAVKALQVLGADVGLRDSGASSAHDLALAGGHAEVAVLLRPAPKDRAAAAAEEGEGQEGAGGQVQV